MRADHFLRCLLAGLCLASFASDGSAAAADENPGTRRITDAAGREVTLPGVVNRVADPWHANNAMVVLLGGGGKLVATTQQAKRQPWLRRLYPRIAEVPAAFDASGDVNFEALLSVRPDVVLMAYDGTLPRWSDAAKANGIPVVLMPNTSLQALQTTARITGQVLGPAESAVAEDFIRYFDGNVRRVRQRTDRLEPTRRPKVLHTATAGVLAVDGRGTVVDDWINVAGGTNAATVTGNGRPVTLEQVVQWNPDVIIVGTAPNAETRDAILRDPRWRDIEAVKRGRVYVNPTGAYLWDRHSGEAALQVLWAAQLLHPELFGDLNLREETRAFYARYFHYALSDAELDSIFSASPP